MPSLHVSFMHSTARVDLAMQRHTALLRLHAADDDGVDVWTQVELNRADLAALRAAVGKVLAGMAAERVGEGQRALRASG